MKYIVLFFFIVHVTFFHGIISATEVEPKSSPCSGKKQGVDCLIFSAPPRGKNEEKTYVPIVEYLSEKLGIPVFYKKPTNWWRYNSDMRKDAFDMLFDGPHYVSWRVNNIGHFPILRLPEDQVWLFIVRKDSSVQKRRHNRPMLDDLVGKKACVQGFTNFARLSLFSFFDNPLRQPIPVRIGKRDKSYLGVVDGKCEVGVVSAKEFERLNNTYKNIHALASLDKHFFEFYKTGEINEVEFSSINVRQLWDAKKLRQKLVTLIKKNSSLALMFEVSKKKVPLVVRVLHENKSNPNQAITISARLPTELRNEIIALLASHEGQEALLNLRNRFTRGLHLTSTAKSDYKNVHEVLMESYGFGFDFH